MNIIDYSIKNRTVTLFLTFVIIVGGIFSYMKLGKLEDPEFRVKEAIVVTLYPGADPHQVELQVTDEIESALQQIENVEYIESVSKAGYSEVKIKLNEALKAEVIDQYWDNVRKKINDAQKNLPSGVIPSIVLDDYGDVYGMFFAVTSEGYSKEELNRYVKYIKRELHSIPEVSKTTIYGKVDSAVEVVIDREKIDALGINEKLILTSFISQNLPAYSNSIEHGDMKIRVDINEAFNSLEDIENLVVFSKDNLRGGEETVLLKDIAVVKKSFSTPVKSKMRYNMKEAMGLMLSPEVGTNVINTGKAIDKKLDEIKKNLPMGIEIEKVYYQPELVTNAIGQFVNNLVASVVVVVGVLLFTMGMRSGLIIGSELILSILGTLIYMLAVKMDMQRVSLGSFIIAMGMLVDNAIVVVDGTLTSLEKGENRYEALTKPAKKTAVPLLGATAIAVIAFLPMYLMPTDAGEYISTLFWIMAVSLGLSWILALTQIPVFCDIFLKIDKEKDKNGRKEKFYDLCHKFLEKVLAHKFLSLGIVIGAFLFSMLLFTRLPITFFPDSDKKGFVVNLWLPEGTSLEKTDKISQIVEKELLKDKDIINVTAAVGSSPSRYYVATIPELQNNSFSQLIISVNKLESVNRIGENIKKFVRENIPDTKIEARKYVNGIPTKYPVEVRILGPDPYVLRELSKKVMNIMRAVPNAENIQTDWKNKVLIWSPVLSQNIERKNLISPLDVANSLNRATEGMTLGKYKEGTEIMPIVLREKSGGQQLEINNIGQTPVWGLGIKSLPLNRVIEKESLKWEDPEIWRRNRIRAIKVQCDISGGVTAESIRKAVEKEVNKLSLPDNYKIEWGGEYYEQNKNVAAVFSTLPLQGTIMFTICVFLFATLKDPLIIFAILPLSFIGIAPGLFLTGRSFGFMSIIGAISLSGMMIKNSIVLIDEIKYEINVDKKDPYTAIIDSAISRIRPVSMASVTTIFGMLPLIFDPLYGDMAITIVFGLTASTMLTLFVVPLLYSLLYKIEKQQ